VGDQVEAIGFGTDGDAPLASVVTGLETFGQTLPQAQAGDNAAVLLRGIRRHQVRRGQVITSPGSIRA
jgi:elongation factor Tu